MSKELHFNCYLGQMFVSDVSNFLIRRQSQTGFFYCKRGSIIQERRRQRELYYYTTVAAAANKKKGKNLNFMCVF